MRRFLVVLDAQVWEVDGVASPVSLTKPRAGIYAWGADPDDALHRAEVALSSLIAAENAGDIPRGRT